MRKRRRPVKKDKVISSKVDEKLKSALQKSIEFAKWNGGESALLRQCAEAFNDQVGKGEEIAQPIRLLTVEQRRILDVLEFQRKEKK